MTWFQAQQACLLANKQLCTNGQWQGAAAGTHDKGKYNGAAGGACHTGGTGPRKTGMAGQAPGASASCISSWGAEDMIGNLWEWVDMWGQAGMTWLTTNGQLTAPWPSGKGYGDGGDSTWNINGRAAAATTAFVNGSPAAAIRSGSWAYGVDAGTFALGMDSSPARWSAGIGARCCIE